MDRIGDDGAGIGSTTYVDMSILNLALCGLRPASRFLLRRIMFQTTRAEGGRDTIRARIPMRASTEMSMFGNGSRSNVVCWDWDQRKPAKHEGLGSSLSASSTRRSGSGAMAALILQDSPTK
ncbi:hypothetical protein GQ53DRAFT_765178 [Thozetella sp. PMI_491]|nr:hypothetical protein GQ53DRAFT_765178 [Thozetella sp. PMI_491]